MEALLAFLATEAGVAAAFAVAGAVAAAVQTVRERKASSTARATLDAAAIMAHSLEIAHAHALASGDIKGANDIRAIKFNIKRLAALGRVENEVVAPLLDELRKAVEEANERLRELDLVPRAPVPPSEEVAIQAVHTARERWLEKGLRPTIKGSQGTAIGGTIGILLAMPLLVSCASYSALCPPRLTGEVIVEPQEPGDPFAVVLFLPQGAPTDIDWYVLEAHDEVTTLTFPLLFDAPEEP